MRRMGVAARRIVLAVACLWPVAAAGCLADEPADESAAEAALSSDSVPEAPMTVKCSEAADAYTPYVDSGSPSGAVSKYPWRGIHSTYPNGIEKFAAYTPLPRTVECSNEKGERNYLDVTDGCLSAVEIGSYTRGEIHAASDDAFRTVALGYASGNDAPLKWTDVGESYRFYYKGTKGTQNNPGFKAFLRYRTEDDLYVASWRVDGVAQIQRKHCGVYTPLVVKKGYGAPSVNAWHTIEFTAVGDNLDVYLDGDHALHVTDNVFTWGTAGIRADAMDGAYLDDWTVFAP